MKRRRTIVRLLLYTDATCVVGTKFEAKSVRRAPNAITGVAVCVLYGMEDLRNKVHPVASDAMRHSIHTYHAARIKPGALQTKIPCEHIYFFAHHLSH